MVVTFMKFRPEEDQYLSCLRIFRSIIYAFIQKNHCKKSDNHTIECIFLRYEEQKAYKSMSTTNCKIINSCKMK